jgi:hypothetical protein
MPERIDYADQTAELVEMIATRYQAFAKRA